MLMDIQHNADLRPFNTFGIAAKAHSLAHFSNAEEARELLEHAKTADLEILILGGGSNLLFTRDHTGLVMINDIPGIQVLEENDDHVVVRAGAGVNWHELVLDCVSNGFGGIENMSLIPGKVGAAPMQNIGAYGVELKDVFVRLHALERDSGQIVEFNKNQCEFGYRESFFKRAGKGQYIILSVDLALSKNATVNTRYGVTDPTIADVSKAVINIRSSKLPDPKQIGNAGSFFKNPVVATTQFEQLRSEFPKIVGYDVGEGNTKLAAGWLIENAGWKGHQEGDFGVHDRQALVLVNRGNAQGSEIKELSTRIMASIQERFGVELEREVNIY